MRSWNGRSGVELLNGVHEHTSLGKLERERAYTSRHPSVFGKRLPDDKLSYLRVWMTEKEISFLISAVALPPKRRGKPRIERALFLAGFLEPFDGSAKYMSLALY